MARIDGNFTAVSINEGSTFFLPGPEYQRLHKLRIKWLSKGGDELLDEETCGGGRVSFRISEIGYLAFSTPGNRKFLDELTGNDSEEEEEPWKKK